MPGKSSPKDWDFASPEIILKTAGGEITNINNEELEYGNLNFEQGGIIVASSNKLTHKKVCYEIKKIIKENDLYPL
jgi:3'(2'), 5'-bisphosphate nucleotidase